MKRIHLTLLTAMAPGCQERVLVVEPGGYVDDAIAWSTGIEFNEISNGPGWHFNDVEVAVRLTPTLWLRQTHANIVGQTIGEQIENLSIQWTSAIGNEEEATKLFERCESLARMHGLLLVGKAPPVRVSNQDHLWQLEMDLESPSDSRAGASLRWGWLNDGRTSNAYATITFVAKDLAPADPTPR